MFRLIAPMVLILLFASCTGESIVGRRDSGPFVSDALGADRQDSVTSLDASEDGGTWISRDAMVRDGPSPLSHPSPGTVRFSSPVILSGATGFAVEDFTQDGRPDIAAVSASNEVIIFVNQTGASGISSDGFMRRGTMQMVPYPPTAGDVTGDGKVDFVDSSWVLVNESTREMFAFRRSRMELPFSFRDSQATELLADVSGDRRSDWISGSTFLLSLFPMTEGFGERHTFSGSSSSSRPHVEFALVEDIDRDMRNDILVLTQDLASYSCYGRIYAGVPVPMASNPPEFPRVILPNWQDGVGVRGRLVTYRCSLAALLDLDLDGRKDVVLSRSGSLRDTDGYFTAIDVFGMPRRSLEDLSHTEEGMSPLPLLFSFATSSNLAQPPDWRDLDGGDFDGDGRSDIVLTTPNEIIIYQHYGFDSWDPSGQGELPVRVSQTLRRPGSSELDRTFVVDLNGDMRPELIVFSGAQIALYPNDSIPATPSSDGGVTMSGVARAFDGGSLESCLQACSEYDLIEGCTVVAYARCRQYCLSWQTSPPMACREPATRLLNCLRGASLGVGSGGCNLQGCQELSSAYYDCRERNPDSDPCLGRGTTCGSCNLAGCGFCRTERTEGICLTGDSVGPSIRSCNGVWFGRSCP